MNNKEYIIFGVGAIILIGVSILVCSATTYTANWSTQSSGGAECAKQYSRACSTGCGASASGSATCIDPATQGVTWTSNSTGNATCAKNGRTCTAAYDVSGGSITCTNNAGYGAGTALCGATLTQGATWASNSTGSAACGRLGSTCTAAYDAYGGSITCANNAGYGAGSALCSAVTGVGTIWSGTSTGNAACAKLGSTCTTGFDSYGNPMVCGSNGGGTTGSALCATATGVGSSWSSTSTGNAACAKLGSTCTSAYDANGGSITCASTGGQTSGSVLCAIATGVGASWSGATFTGNAACAKLGSTCTAAYDANGGSITCASTGGQTSGNALCPTATGIGASWGGITSTGNAACAKLGSTCTSAYDAYGGSITCTSTGGQTSGNALCPTATGIGVTWSSTTTGNAACAKIGSICTSAYDGYGGSITCASTGGQTSGNALCGQTGHLWSVTNTGNSVCATLGANCTSAYTGAGVASTCGTSMGSGFSFCTATGNEGAGWFIASTGNAQCASLGSTCTAAYSGSTSNTGGTGSTYCSASYSTGGALCGTASSAGTTWYNYNSGGGACAILGRACSAAYNTSGASISCTVSSFGGVTLCGPTLTAGAVWNTTTSTGNTECAAAGRPCIAAYASASASSGGGAVLASCATSNSGGVALCNDPFTAGVIWTSSASTGNASCAGINRTCTAAYDRNGNGGAAYCNTSYSIGAALCGATFTLGTAWTSATTGNAACAALNNRTCAASYNSAGGGGTGSTYCSTSYTSGGALCNTLTPTVTTTKSSTWVDTETNNLGYFWNRWSGSGWDWGLGQRTVNIAYNVGVKNNITGDSINDAGSVQCGTNLTFKIQPHQYNDISWFGNGFSLDSPFGEWKTNADAPDLLTQTVYPDSTFIEYDNTLDSTLNECPISNVVGRPPYTGPNGEPCVYVTNAACPQGYPAYGSCWGYWTITTPYQISTPVCATKDFVNSVFIGCGFNYNVDIYIPLEVAPPSSETITNTTGMSCGSIVGDGKDGYSINCVANTLGSVSPQFNLGSTIGKFYYRYYDYRSGQFYTPGCYGNQTAMETTTGAVDYSCNGISHYSQPYTLNVPAQTIPYSITVTAPPTPTISAAPASLDINQTSTISWNTNGIICTASASPADANWSGSKTSTTTQNTTTAPITASTTYTLTCPCGATASTTVSMTTPVAGTCGTAAKTYPNGSTAFSGTMCGAGSGTTTPTSPAFPTGDSPTTTWTCGGLNGGGSSPTCTANLTVNGSCGSAAQTYTTSN